MHGHLLRGEDVPVCGQCNVPLSVFHILIICPKYDAVRGSLLSNIMHQYIPMHPDLLLGDEALVPHKEFLSS